MKILLILLCTFFGTVAIAQENSVINDADAKTRTLNASFSAISVTDGIEVYLSQGTEESLAISYSDEKYAEHFKTIVEKGVLKIYYDNNAINWSDNNRRKLKAYVSFKTLEKLTASGGANVKLPAGIDVASLEIKCTSGSYFKGNIKAKQLVIDQNSGSEVNISGSSDKISIEAGSGASFKGYELAVGFCDAQASSGAEIRITVEKELSAKANSGGGIHYKGTAVIKDISINSGGVVKKSK